MKKIAFIQLIMILGFIFSCSNDDDSNNSLDVIGIYQEENPLLEDGYQIHFADENNFTISFNDSISHIGTYSNVTDTSITLHTISIGNFECNCTNEYDFEMLDDSSFNIDNFLYVFQIDEVSDPFPFHLTFRRIE